MKVNAVIISGNGTNCETETSFAVKKAGADNVDVVSVWELMKGLKDLSEYNFLCFPGGFMDGDHLGSAKAGAVRFAYAVPENGKPPLMQQINELLNRQGLIIGICNGFQLLVKLGLLPEPGSGQKVTLTRNLNGKFEDRWVKLKVNPDSPSVFTRGTDYLELPVRHGEGRLVFDSAETLEMIESDNLAPLVYVNPKTDEATEDYPFNPNGSPHGIAALTDPSGQIFGLMPHPEAFTHMTNHPQWTRKKLPEKGAGLLIFENAINHLKNL